MVRLLSFLSFVHFQKPLFFVFHRNICNGLLTIRNNKAQPLGWA